MAHEHIKRLNSRLDSVKQDNIRRAALVKNAAGEPLNAQEREVIEEIAKARALEQRLRERLELGGAIEKLLREPTSNQTGELSYSAAGGTEPLQKERDAALE